MNGARPQKGEENFIEKPNLNPTIKLTEKGNAVFLEMNIDTSIFDVSTFIITTKTLGSTFISEALFENSDGTSYILNSDYFGNPRNSKNSYSGPFEKDKNNNEE